MHKDTGIVRLEDWLHVSVFDRPIRRRAPGRIQLCRAEDALCLLSINLLQIENWGNATRAQVLEDSTDTHWGELCGRL